MRSTDILVVDDVESELRILEMMLVEQGYTVLTSRDGQSALRMIAQYPPELILLDINMPHMNGYEVCKLLKAYETTRDIPVIFISGLDEALDKVRAFEVGGVDYVTKPFEFIEVLARIQAHLALYRQRREIDRMRQAERLYFERLSNMRDELMTTLSHDLKNPLSHIHGAVYLLREQYECLDEDGQKVLDVIDRGTQRMLSLVTDLLDLARLETGLALNKTSQSVNNLVNQAADTWRYICENKGVCIHTSLLPEDMQILFDYERMDQVLQNLISNAVKYTPIGGTIELGAESKPGTVVIYVSDTGTGIPADALPSVYEKFYRVPGKHQIGIQGAGLGLSIVKSIVDQHGGTLHIKSELGTGTVFSVSLPLFS